MSGVYGILDLSGNSVSKADLQKMKDAMNYWGPDKNGLWMDGHIGIGNLLLHSTNESLYEDLPLVSNDESVVLSCAARIDNRKELASVLDVDFNDPKIPDSHYILRAYERWGEDCCKNLKGDWSFVIWDKKSKSLLIARDQYGLSGLYFCTQNKKLLFASSMKAILALGYTYPVNRTSLAMVMLGFSPSGKMTFYENIHRIPPGHFIKVGENGIIRDNQFWNLNNVVPVRFKKKEEYVECFIDKIDQATRRRLRSLNPVATTLSGGIDSGTISYFAARNSNSPIQSYVSVPKYNPPEDFKNKFIWDEYELALESARHIGRIDLQRVDASNLSPIEGLRRNLEVFGEPIRNAVNSYWLHALFEHASNDKIGTLLVAQTGNMTISWPLNQNSIGGRNILEMSSGFLKLSKVLMIKILKSLSNNPYSKNYFLSNSLAREIGGKYFYKRELKRFFHFSDTRKTNLQVNDTLLGGIYSEIGAYYKLNIYDPTRDLDLVEYCFAIPRSVFYEDGYRGLISKSMKQHLPESVLLNNKRARQASDFYYRSIEEQAKIEDLLLMLNEKASLHDIFDVGAMDNYIASLKKGIKPEQIATYSFYRALECAMWLLH